MKNITNFLLCVLVSLTPAITHAQTKRKPAKAAKTVQLDNKAYLLEKDLWEMDITDFNKKYSDFKFVYQTRNKKSTRAEAQKNIKTFGQKSGEIIVKSDDGNVKLITVVIYNKGDDGQINKSAFTQIADRIISSISKELGSEPKKYNKRGAMNLVRYLWKRENSAFALEKSLNRAGKPEFIRLRITSVKDVGRKSKTTNRGALKGNVVFDKKTGDHYVDNVPMVDQGKKGYCACASAARIYQYYGLTVDQHEIAEIAGSSARAGTSIVKMVEALKKASTKYDSRVLVLYEYPKHMTDKDDDYKKWEKGNKEMMRDINSYQSLAKRTEGKSIPFADETGKEMKPYSRIPRGASLSFSYFAYKCDPKIFREVMMKKSTFGRWKSKIKEYTKQGIPVGWCLQLGMFPEPGLPQANGGHMRLIIGYNDKTDEIIYTDSWGPGHERKKMDAGNAFCMTNVILVLPPSK